MQVAALQLDAVFADVKQNLRQVEQYARQAAAQKAGLLLLPEFFPSAIGFSDSMLQVPLKGRTVRPFLRTLAAKYKLAVGGSYLVYDGEHSYNRFDLAFPDGNIFSHSKDLPTQFENCYYTAGDQSHVLHTPIGDIGVALCWEQIRWDTVKRLSGQVDFVLAGSCWWDLPEDAGPHREELRRYNQTLAGNTPRTLARILQAPVLHASHCGIVNAYNFPAGDKLQTRRMVGAAQVIDSSGAAIASRTFDQGPGLVVAQLPSNGKRQQAQIPNDSYWIPDLPEAYTSAWNTLNSLGQEYYHDIARPYWHAHEPISMP